MLICPPSPTLFCLTMAAKGNPILEENNFQVNYIH